MSISLTKISLSRAPHLLLVILVATFSLSCLFDTDFAHAHADSHDDQGMEEVVDHGSDESHDEQLECEDLSEEVITSRVSFEPDATSLQLDTSSKLPPRPSLETPSQFANPPNIETETILGNRFITITQLPRSQLSD